jgi:peptidoglycan/xylan/chitin deacetylase (PgdA/CDA1 family)
MRARAIALLGLICGALAAGGARAADCPGNPNAIGTSRVLTIDPREFSLIGTMQYARSLPLAEKEVVLTFDDGPMPPYSNRVLDVLAEHCVKANYFIIGRMARGYPDVLKRILADGHTIGTHSENHVLAFDRMPLNAVQREIEQGFASVAAVLGDRKAVAPFFRIPGLLRAQQVESYLQSRGIATWSADLAGDDWKHISSADVVRRVMARLEEKGKGVVLLHDIQPATALALPELLRELKGRGYRIVQVAPGAAADRATVAAKPAAPPPAKPEPPAAERPARDAVTKPAPSPGPAAAAALATRSEQLEVATTAQQAAAKQAPTPPPPPAATPGPDVELRATRDAAGAAEATARAEPQSDNARHGAERVIPREPARPFLPTLKPAQSVPTPAKASGRFPHPWPGVVNVPVPRAGGVGVSSVVRTSQNDGRFQAGY